MKEKVIEVVNLDKNYKFYQRPIHRLYEVLRPKKKYHTEFKALKKINFCAFKAETVGILGRNGSGKSTLLKVIAGVIAPTHGEVKVKGQISALLELGAGFNLEFTGRENIYLYGAICGLNRAEITRKMQSILDFADIGEFIDRPVKVYSSGMFVRLAFSVSINVSPQILIVDEALAVGDEAFQRKCFEKIAQLKATGITILFVTHSTQIISELCDRAVYMKEGEVVEIGEPKDIINLYHRDLYGDSAEESSAFSSKEKLKKITVDRNYFDPSLVSLSRVEYPVNGLRIEDITILNSSGQQVNILEKDQRYRITYHVTTSTDLYNVRFGNLIRNVTGIEIAGKSFPDDYETIACLEGKKEYIFEVEFPCHFNSGTYFLTVGLAKVENGVHHFLHRVMDALSFRVESGPYDTAFGHMDLRAKGRYFHLSP